MVEEFLYFNHNIYVRGLYVCVAAVFIRYARHSVIWPGNLFSVTTVIRKIPWKQHNILLN